MLRSLCLMGLMCLMASAQDNVVKANGKLPGISLKASEPLPGGAYAKGSVISPVAGYTLVNTPSSWVYVEIEGANYYWGDAVLATVGSGTAYFGQCNALPTGTYTCTVYSLDFGTSDTITFSVMP